MTQNSISSINFLGENSCCFYNDEISTIIKDDFDNSIIQNSFLDFNLKTEDFPKSFEKSKINNSNEPSFYENFYAEKQNDIEKAINDFSSISKTINERNESYMSFPYSIIDKIKTKGMDQSISIKNNTVFSTYLYKDDTYNNSKFDYSHYLNKNRSIVLNRKRERNENDLSFENLKKNKFVVIKSELDKSKTNLLSNQSDKEGIKGIASKGSKQNNKKHDKYYFDNISKKIESLSNNFIINKINSELKNIKNYEFKKYFGDKMFLKIGNKEENKPSKKYYRDLMKTTFNTIFSKKTSKIYNENKLFHNKKLIEKLYELKEKGFEEFSKIVNFLELKFEEFWKFLSIYLKYNDKTTIEGKSIIDDIDNDYLFLKELIKEFICHINQYFEKKNEEEEYRKVFIFVLEDFHLRCET